MSREYVNHKEIVNFAQNQVNLPKDKSDKYRAQVRNLREKLEEYLGTNPDFKLRKMILSGSLAKGTALRSLNDIDVACYIKGEEFNIQNLLQDLSNYLCSKFPNFNSDQITCQNYSLKISFRGTGLDVDIVPILYNGDSNWDGDLISQEDGTLLKTNILRHIKFIQKRKEKCEHFSQIVRLIKFWIQKTKRENPDFKFKSFMVEIILAHLLDKGFDFSDYPEVLQHFFTYIATSQLQKRIEFFDYYEAVYLESFDDPVQIIDPVNKSNNVSKNYSKEMVSIIVEKSLEAGDAIDAALYATTKQKTVYYWQKIFGSSFFK